MLFVVCSPQECENIILTKVKMKIFQLAMFSLDWIIISFVIHLTFRVEKSGKSTYGSSSNGGIQLGELGSKTFRGKFEAIKNVFGGIFFSI